MKYPDMASVRLAAAVSKHSQHFFDPEHLDAWKTKFYEELTDDGHGGAFFFTSDQPDPDQPRMWSLRHVDAEGEIRPVDEDFTLFPGLASSGKGPDFTRLPTLAEARSKLSIAGAGSRIVAHLDADASADRLQRFLDLRDPQDGNGA